MISSTGQVGELGVLADRLRARRLVDADGADRAAALVEHVAADPADVVRHLLVADRASSARPPRRRSSGERQPLRRRITYRSMWFLLSVMSRFVVCTRRRVRARAATHIGRTAYLSTIPRRAASRTGLAARRQPRACAGSPRRGGRPSLGEEQPRGDLRVAQPLGHERERPRARAPSARPGSRASRPAGPGCTSRSAALAQRRARRGAAAGRAPRRCSSASASPLCGLVVGVAASASAASYGQPSAVQRSAAALVVAGRARGGTARRRASRAKASRRCPRDRARRRARPPAQRSRTARARGERASVSAAIASLSPASQRASARAAATGAEALQLAGAARELERLVERRPRIGVAAARAQAAEHA